MSQLFSRGFLVWLSGLLLAVLAALFKTVEGSAEYFASVLLSVLQKTKDIWRLPNLIWLYHITACSADCEAAAFSEKELSRLGALRFEVLLDPPRAIDDPDWGENMEKRIDVDRASDPRRVRTECAAHVKKAAAADARLLAVGLLLEDGPVDLPFDSLLRLLY
jgi:hypothetical protein